MVAMRMATGSMYQNSNSIAAGGEATIRARYVASVCQTLRLPRRNHFQDRRFPV